ncbi:hypothetical protein ACFLRA_03180 [Bdellovibrionota bacterium]
MKKNLTLILVLAGILTLPVLALSSGPVTHDVPVDDIGVSITLGTPSEPATSTTTSPERINGFFAEAADYFAENPEVENKYNFSGLSTPDGVTHYYLEILADNVIPGIPAGKTLELDEMTNLAGKRVFTPQNFTVNWEMLMGRDDWDTDFSAERLATIPEGAITLLEEEGTGEVETGEEETDEEETDEEETDEEGAGEVTPPCPDDTQPLTEEQRRTAAELGESLGRVTGAGDGEEDPGDGEVTPPVDEEPVIDPDEEEGDLLSRLNDDELTILLKTMSENIKLMQQLVAVMYQLVSAIHVAYTGQPAPPLPEFNVPDSTDTEEETPAQIREREQQERQERFQRAKGRLDLLKAEGRLNDRQYQHALQQMRAYQLGVVPERETEGTSTSTSTDTTRTRTPSASTASTGSADDTPARTAERPELTPERREELFTRFQGLYQRSEELMTRLNDNEDQIRTIASESTNQRHKSIAEQMIRAKGYLEQILTQLRESGDNDQERFNSLLEDAESRAGGIVANLQQAGQLLSHIETQLNEIMPEETESGS